MNTESIDGEGKSTPYPQRLTGACLHCSLRALCIPDHLPIDLIEQLAAFVHNIGPLHKGETLIRAGEPFRAVYAIRSGLLKSSVFGESNAEHVAEFLLPGELIGLDAIAAARHITQVTVLDTAVVCRVPYEQLLTLSRRVPGLERRLLRILSAEISHEEWFMALEGAENRVASFLIGFGAKMEVRGYSAVEFTLKMTRRDIASHLRIAPETLSRVLKVFQERGLISIKGKKIHLLDRFELETRCSHPAGG